ncbi:urea ABC transporter ATP-binding subunit UrtE [Agrobacterium tumefaciens]|uniref:urea ABC transporter ATP-binding subunit UrtE n=1 Tax=Agrobacterium tumefaciens TaxID=358 RepID=UPI00287DFD28|nr:urea ABC transporter ATP-binding subunit UrtE [Agrobacterium tumefaciens]MDS7595454.1 urea ABC transporter ATP-binding subunit UrtE [Agrobacterium tumefaciens]
MLELSNLHVSYGGSTVVRGVDLTMDGSGISAIIGRNGMGKSTLLKSVIGMMPVRSGQIRFDGVDVTREPSYRRVRAGMAYVPQGRMIFPGLTVEENISTGLETRRYDRIPDFVFDFFPVLSEMRLRKGGLLSGGQQQQLAIARALVSKPKLLILDEPTEGIQPSIIKEIARTLGRLGKELGITILFSEQVLSFALDLSQTLHVIDRGQIVRTARCEDVDVDDVKSFLTI